MNAITDFIRHQSGSTQKETLMNLLTGLTALSGLSISDNTADIQFCFAEAEHPPVALSGSYRLDVSGLQLEIELIETDSCARSLVYVKSGDPLFLFIPAGDYSFHLRFLSTAGVFPASLHLTRLSLFARIGFAACKLVSLLQRPPSDWVKVLRQAFRSRDLGVTGATAGKALPPLPTRPNTRQGLSPGKTYEGGVSVIIPTKVHHHHLSACIRSLDLTQHFKEIIVVDNGAEGPEMIGYLAKLGTRDDVRVIRHDAPFNFSQLCNLGARHAQHNSLLFLNDDVEALESDWLDAMLAYLNRPDVGVVGARLLYPDDTLQHAGVAINLIPGPGHPWRGLSKAEWQTNDLICRSGETDAVTAACLLIDRSVFNTVGGFDEICFPVTLNDVDLCLKVRQLGLKIIYTPEATLIHKEGQSRRADDDPAEFRRRQGELKAFYKRYGDCARVSNFYPPNLRRDTDKGYAIEGLYGP